MSTIKEKVENSPVIWMLGILLVSFLSGIGTYEAALKITNLDTIDKDSLQTLKQNFQKSTPLSLQEQLPSYIDKKEIDRLFKKIEDAFNKKDINGLYSMLGPIARANISKESAQIQMKPLFDHLGKIKDSFYV